MKESRPTIVIGRRLSSALTARLVVGHDARSSEDDRTLGEDETRADPVGADRANTTCDMEWDAGCGRSLPENVKILTTFSGGFAALAPASAATAAAAVAARVLAAGSAGRAPSRGRV
jgi:hypothetical protein